MVWRLGFRDYVSGSGAWGSMAFAGLNGVYLDSTESPALSGRCPMVFLVFISEFLNLKAT